MESVQMLWVPLSQNNHSGESWIQIERATKPPTGGFLTSLLVFILVAAVVKLVFDKKKCKLHLPGPTPLPIVGNGLLMTGGPLKLIGTISNLLDVYNGFLALWIGPKLHVFISKPEDLEIFCTHPKLLNKSEHYRYVTPTLGDGIFSSNGTTWRNGRKLIMPTLRPAVLKALMPNFLRHTKVLIDVIGKEEGGAVFDVFPYLRNCSYDMIFETIYGRRISTQTVELPELDYTEEAMDLMYQRAFKLWLQWDPLYKILPVGRRLFDLCEHLNSFNLGHILKTLGSGDSKNDQLLVHQLSSRLGEQFDLIREHITTMIVTGYDTTAGTMGFVLLMLAIHEDVQEQVYEEVVRIKAQVGDRGLEAADLNEFELLERVIKETLRLFPVGPIMFRSASDDIQFGEHVVPKGASVACTMFHTHRNPNIYPNPLKFNPDNFLPERVAGRHPYAFIPFSAGPRGCIGVKYGMMSMKVMISELVYHYHLTCDMKMTDIQLKPEITMKCEGGYPIKIRRRSASATKY